MNLQKLTCAFLFLLIIVGCHKSDTVITSGGSLYKEIHLVPQELAREVAEKFNPSTFIGTDQSTVSRTSTSQGTIEATLKGNNAIKNEFVFKDSSGNPAIYIYNFVNDGGFVIVSADFNIQPILAFVEKGEFKKDTVPPAIIQWVNRTFENTEIVRKGLYDNKKAAAAAWKEYLTKNEIDTGKANFRIPPPPACEESTTSITVGPLLTVTWGQGCTYNNLCPSRSCTNVCTGSPNAWTGCVATAVAQVVRFWQPVTQYNYNYASMPAGSGNIEVQRLMRDIGLPANVDMDYQCTGSASNGSRIPNALKTNFGFRSANEYEYTGSSYSIVRSNLSSRRPVFLSGCRSQRNRFLGFYYTYSDCHLWVCDGYRSTDFIWCNPDGTTGGGSTLYFHMNWGWNEVGISNNYNGWFAFNNWNIAGLNYNYQYSKSMIADVYP